MYSGYTGRQTWSLTQLGVLSDPPACHWCYNFPAKCAPISLKNTSTNRHTVTKIQERTAVTSGYTKLPKLFFSSNSGRSVEAPVKLISMKAAWTWTRMYLDLYNTAKKLIKKDAWRKFYNTSWTLYLVTHMEMEYCRSGIRWVVDVMNCQTIQHQQNSIECCVVLQQY